MKEKYILLVEDNPDDVALAELALRKGRITNKMTVVWNGEEALDFLFARGEYCGRDPCDIPAVILLDLKLPILGGLEVLREIRSRESTAMIPVVVLTSSSEESDQAQSYLLGADGYIQKPPGLTDSIKIMHQIGARYLQD